MANIGECGHRNACAACKHQRKKCKEGCILYLYFPGDRSEEFQSIHKIFGVSNLSKILQNIDNHRDREEAVKSIRWEAFMWKQDLVHGPLGAYKKLEGELERLKNLLNRQISVQSIPPYVTNSGSIGINTTQHRENAVIPYNDDAIAAMYYSNTNQNNIMQREDKKGHALDCTVPAPPPPPPPPYVTTSAQGQERVSRGSGIVIAEALAEPRGRGQIVGCSSSIICPLEQGGLRASQGIGYVTPLYSMHCDQQQGMNYQGNYRGGYDVAASYAAPRPPPPSLGVSPVRGCSPYQYNNFIWRHELGQYYDTLVQPQQELYAEGNPNHSHAIQ